MKGDIKELIAFSRTLKVLLVEDNLQAREQASTLLQTLFDKVESADDGLEGLKKFKAQTFDLVISDINMPNMNGIEMVTKMKEIEANIPVIILSAHSETHYFMDTIKLGVTGYILKPINLKEFMSTLYETIERIKLRYEVEKYKNELEALNSELEEKVVQRTQEIVSLNQEITETQREVVFTMGTIGETRSKETGNHVKRVAKYSELLALLYGIDSDEAQLLKEASPMHDIGKVGIPDAILHKEGKFDENECAIMRTHCELGFDMLKHSNRPILKTAAIVAIEHHEKYDGTGYPNRLAGSDIHIYGRITALADVFDALGSKRCYKIAWDDEEIFKLLRDERGKHFDPKLVDIFFENLNDFLKIRDEFIDV